MTEEKKNGEVTEAAEEKKPVDAGDKKEIKAEGKKEAGQPEKKKEEVREPEEKKEAKSPEEAPAEKKTEKKETAEEETPEKDTELESEETESGKEAVPEEPVAEKKAKKDLGNLNFYPELRTDIPEIRSGDILKIFYRVLEGGKERIQVFEGTVIAMKNSGISKTITVRKTSFGIAIERIFPLNSKLVQKIEVIKRSRVRRAKLYYLRKLKGKAARLKELR